jgi:hypothetical protein
MVSSQPSLIHGSGESSQRAPVDWPRPSFSFAAASCIRVSLAPVFYSARDMSPRKQSTIGKRISQKTDP